MESCIKCGEPTNTIWGKNGYLCDNCRRKMDEDRIIEKSKDVMKPSDFKEWESRDMSELFWIHLGKYVKEPNRESLAYMEMAYSWACHDNHGLSNSFRHALKWAGIDLWNEYRKWENKDD